MVTIRIDEPMRMSPNIHIGANAEPPSLVFETSLSGPHEWDWEIRWRSFAREGGMSTVGPRLNLGPMLAGLGGDLSVRCKVGVRRFHFRWPIYGVNPAWPDVKAYINEQPASEGFADIVHHESKGKHFRANGQPVVSFDGGYGLCQLTRPAPTYEQVWSWKRNVDAGLKLFAAKRREAETYLSSRGSYTTEQLKYETVCRWNGGAYHKWIDGRWVRNPDILCDGKTGNIGWNMTDPDNAGKTETELHLRDKGTYRRGRQNTDEWRYFGVCYADALLK